jgi:hypothetical protein
MQKLDTPFSVAPFQDTPKQDNGVSKTEYQESDAPFSAYRKRGNSLWLPRSMDKVRIDLKDTLKRLSKLLCLNCKQTGDYNSCSKCEAHRLINELLQDG